jgi:hypothetical protein
MASGQTNPSYTMTLLLITDRVDLRTAATEAVLQIRDFKHGKDDSGGNSRTTAKNCSYTEGKGVVSVNALNPFAITCHRTVQSVCQFDGIKGIA